mmetsp:Transcript_114859/g.223124  ORF Transcript_114859/g.223124 Transcript_114859/m.223124 type:complete len:876 (+) Transcript_114859:52-2679(+)
MQSRHVQLPSDREYTARSTCRNGQLKLWHGQMGNFLLPGRLESERSVYTRIPTSPKEENGCRHEPDRPPEQEALERGVEEPSNGVLEDGQDAADHDSLDDEAAAQPNCWSFVNRAWFLAITAVVIFANAATTFFAMDRPSAEESLFYPESAMLCFYLFEITARISAFGKVYFCGKWRTSAWNWLDIITVTAGIFDQWINPELHLGGALMGKILTSLRLLRLLRVLKIVRVFLEADLSWAESPMFQSFIGLIIVFNSLVMGLEVDIPWKGWKILEHMLLVVYVFELAVRMKNFGIRFVNPNNPDITWNVLDSLIVCSSVADSWVMPLCAILRKSLFGAAPDGSQSGGISLSKVMMLMRMLRLFRILRLVKLVKAVRPLFILVTSMVSAFQGVVWVLVLTIVTLYGMAIITTSLIGHRLAFPPEAHISDEVIMPFSTVPESMFTLFRVMSGASSDKEAAAIDAILETLPTLKFAFVFFMITSSWTLLSILTAVVSENMITSTGTQEQELKMQTEEEDRLEHKATLQDLFDEMDEDGSGSIGPAEVAKFLFIKENRQRAAKSCRVPTRHIQDVLGTLSDAMMDGKINSELFIEYLIDAGDTVTEKSLMKLEFRMKTLFRNMEQRIDVVEERLIKSHHAPGMVPQTTEVIDDLSQPSQHKELLIDVFSQSSQHKDGHLPASIPAGHTESEDPVVKQDSIHAALEEWHLPGVLLSGQIKSEDHICNHPYSHQMPATGQEAHEKVSFEQKIRACDQFNQKLLSKTQEHQRRHMEFLETLERRWQRMDTLSEDVTEHLNVVLQGQQPSHCMQELRAGLEHGHQHSSNCEGRPLQAAGQRTAHHSSAQTAIPEQCSSEQKQQQQQQQQQQQRHYHLDASGHFS